LEGLNGGEDVLNRYLRNDRRDIATGKGRSRSRTPVQGLATWFHQDFALMGVEPGEWGKTFMRSLSAEQRRVLRVELLELKAAYLGKSDKGLRNAWIRLGAALWPRGVDLRQAIDSWVEALK
jgi:hypothetical protein